MTVQATDRALSIGTDRDPIFAFLHEPVDERPSGTAVLIVGPWGWDEVVTYRSRRDWAEELARAGHHALRIDLPGTGDSAGSDTDADRPGAWSGAIRAAATMLREMPGIRRVAVIGMGLGGLSAARAIHEGAPVDDLILWASPATGRSWLREQRAFAGMQGTRFSLHGEPEPRLLPEGWLEVGGFVLTSATIGALETLDPVAWSYEGLERALLLDRDGMAADPRLRAHLEAAGVRVTAEAGLGWAAMCADIERHRPPLEVFATVESFLADAAPSATARTIAVPAAGRRPEALRAGPEGVAETPVTIVHSTGRTFGILAEPDARTQTGLCLVFLNAGAVRRIGPNRMWVEAARRWAGRGIPSLRLDIEAIGDADGDPAPFADVNAFYRAGLETQVSAALDDLVERDAGRRFVLVGLCSGAYWAFQVAVADERVVGAVLLNPRGLIWDPHLFVRLASREARKVLQRASWGRFLRGQIGPRRLLGVARTVAVRFADGLRRQVARHLPGRDGLAAESIDGMLAGLDRRGARVALAFSDEEPLAGQLEDDGLPAQFRRWARASYVRLPGRDHTVRPVVAQAAVQDLIDDVVTHTMDDLVAPETESAQDARRIVQSPSSVP